ncbi:MAG TPA: flagellar hook-length control protein FliK [Rhodanobacteraceae bacterium]
MASLQVGAAPPAAPAGNARMGAKGDADAWATAVAAATGETAGPELRTGRSAGSERGETTGRNHGKADAPRVAKDPRGDGRLERVRDDKHRASSAGGAPVPLAIAHVQPARPGIPEATQRAGANAARVAASGGKSRSPATAANGTVQTDPAVPQEAVAVRAASASSAGNRAQTKPAASAGKEGAVAAAAVAPGQREAASAASGDGSQTPVPVDAVAAGPSAATGRRALPVSAARNGKVPVADAASPQLTFADLKKALPGDNAQPVQSAGVALGVLQVPATAAGAGGTQAPGVATTATLARSDAGANAQALGSAVAALHQGGLNAATVQLTPPTLGSVQVQIQVAAGHAASVAFIVAQPAAAQAVQASLPLLTQALQQHGITLAQASVSTGDGGASAWGGHPGGGGQQPQYGQPQQGALVGSGRRGREAVEVVVPKGVRAYA